MKLCEISLNESSIQYTNGKIIAYHGTGNKITQFYDSFLKPHYFTQDIEYAKGYVGGKSFNKNTKSRNYLLTVTLNIKNILDTKNDNEALSFYNTVFLPHINEIKTRYKQPPVKELNANYPSFIDSDDLYRFMVDDRFHHNYDGILVNEGSFTSPAIVPLKAYQITIIKTQIIKFQESNSFLVKV